MRLFLTLFLFIAVFARTDRYFFKQNDSFNLNFIYPIWSKLPEIETPPPSLESSIFAQPFYYLAKGQQCYAFKSQDGKWILKFFRLPRSFRYGKLDLKKEDTSKFLEGLFCAKWAYETLEAETKVAYAHLQKTHHLERDVDLVDLYGTRHKINLDHLPFFLQRCGIPYFPYLRSAGIEEAKNIIRDTLLLFSSLYEKGFIDCDPILDKNFGIVDQEPFILDVGQLEKRKILPPKEIYLEEMTQSLGGYLQRESPGLYPYYKNLLSGNLSSVKIEKYTVRYPCAISY